jgi:hypothetical protein
MINSMMKEKISTIFHNMAIYLPKFSRKFVEIFHKVIQVVLECLAYHSLIGWGAFLSPNDMITQIKATQYMMMVVL